MLGGWVRTVLCVLEALGVPQGIPLGGVGGEREARGAFPQGTGHLGVMAQPRGHWFITISCFVSAV